MTTPVTCPLCGHDALHDPQTGCTFVYSSTAKGGGVGGQALTGCGCGALPEATIAELVAEAERGYDVPGVDR